MLNEGNNTFLKAQREIYHKNNTRDFRLFWKIAFPSLLEAVEPGSGEVWLLAACVQHPAL